MSPLCCGSVYVKGSGALETPSKLSQDEVEEHEEAAEKMDPWSEPWEDVEHCVMTGYAANDEAGALPDGKYCSRPRKDWAEVGQVISGPEVYCDSFECVGGGGQVERVVKL